MPTQVHRRDPARMDMTDTYGEFLDEFLEPFYEAWQADPEAAWAILAFERREITAEDATLMFGDITERRGQAGSRSTGYRV